MSFVSIRKLKRGRSDSKGEMDDGYEFELEERFRTSVRIYIQNLISKKLISSDIYFEILDRGVDDRIITRKMNKGISSIYNFYEERRLCSYYISKQKQFEKKTFLQITDDAKNNGILGKRQHPFFIDLVINNIISYIVR
jgi:hypothetical protein